MLYNFSSRRLGACFPSSLLNYRRWIPASRARKDHLETTRTGQSAVDVDMDPPDAHSTHGGYWYGGLPEEEEDTDAQIKRRKF